MEESIIIDQPKKRPNFLTVLCIITFIWSGGVMLLYGAYDYFTFPTKYDANMEQIQKAVENLEEAGMDSGYMYENAVFSMEQMKIKKDNLLPMTGINFLFAILCLLGAFLMFKQKKNGFYLYTFASVFWLLVPLYYFDFATPNLVQVGIGAFFSFLFIILYAVNLKHME